MILGVSGGNTLEHIAIGKYLKVYGVVININYLDNCVKRYPKLHGAFIPIQADLTKLNVQLPRADLMIANLLIEFIVYETFQNDFNTENQNMFPKWSRLSKRIVLYLFRYIIMYSID
jgi:hypothetical protein